MAISSLAKSIYIILNILSIFTTQTLSESIGCSSESTNDCNDKAAALPLKITAIITILISSIIGVCTPLVKKSMPAFRPDKDIFVIVKSFAAGIILATGFMQVLPHSTKMLTSSCLNDNPWKKFAFSYFVAMISVVLVNTVESVCTSFCSSRCAVDVERVPNREICTDKEPCSRSPVVQGHGHTAGDVESSNFKEIVRYSVIVMVLGVGIVVHSVVIGLSLGASNNTCMIKSLVLAMCFHQTFEGMGLGGSILQVILAIFFSVTTPLGIVLGMALTKTYKENSPSSLITVGLLNAGSAGLLICMALVDLIAVYFMSPKLQSSIPLQLKANTAILLGCGCMSILSIWA